MDSPQRQAEMKFLIEKLQEKLKDLEAARKRDAVFEERKALYTEIKSLNTRLQLCLEQANIIAPDDYNKSE